MRAFPRMRCECAHFRAWDANAHICAHFAHAMRMLAHARISPHAMRCDANARMRCDANARIKGELMRVRYCTRTPVRQVRTPVRRARSCSESRESRSRSPVSRSSSVESSTRDGSPVNFSPALDPRDPFLMRKTRRVTVRRSQQLNTRSSDKLWLHQRDCLKSILLRQKSFQGVFAGPGWSGGDWQSLIVWPAVASRHNGFYGTYSARA